MVAHGKILLHVGQVPPAAVQAGTIIVENYFEDGLCVLPEPLRAEGDNATVSYGRLAQRQVRNFDEIGPILIAPRPVQQEIANGLDLELAERGRAFGPDA
jgi:hypothetical protein